MLQWKRFAVPPSHSQIGQFEKQSGTHLPPRYRGFLLASNGGQPCEYVGFEDAEAGEKVMLGCLYAISDEESGVNLKTVYEDLFDALPEGFIAIGADPGGNQLLLAVKGNDIEGIYYWDRVGFFSRRTGKTTFRIAKNIDEFLKSLHFMPDK